MRPTGPKSDAWFLSYKGLKEIEKIKKMSLFDYKKERTEIREKIKGQPLSSHKNEENETSHTSIGCIIRKF